MVAIPTQTVNKVIKDFQSEIDDFILIAKGNLEDLRDKGILTNAEKSFVIKILTYDIRKIILASPTELDLFVKKIGKVPKQRATKQGKRFKSLKDEIVERLGYSSLRSSFYPKYFQKIGIKACVYCNSQLTVSTESIKKINKKKIRYIKTYKAKFQVDHYYPKVEYPYLSISLFNLYPVCASCNNSKSDKELIFELYSDNPTKLNKSDFEFSFVDGSVARYKTSKDIDDIEFTFNEPISIKNSSQKDIA